MSFEKLRLTAVFCTAFNKTAVLSVVTAVFIRALLAVSKTAVQSVITAVFDIAVVGGFKNRGVLGNYHGFRYSEY